MVVLRAACHLVYCRHVKDHTTMSYLLLCAMHTLLALRYLSYRTTLTKHSYRQTSHNITRAVQRLLRGGDHVRGAVEPSCPGSMQRGHPFLSRRTCLHPSYCYCRPSWRQQHHRKHPYRLSHLFHYLPECDFVGWACSPLHYDPWYQSSTSAYMSVPRSLRFPHG